MRPDPLVDTAPGARSARLAGLRLGLAAFRVSGWRRRRLIDNAPRHTFLELAHRLTERARQLGQLLGSEEKDAQRERYPEILWSEHGRSSRERTPGVRPHPPS